MISRTVVFRFFLVALERQGVPEMDAVMILIVHSEEGGLSCASPSIGLGTGAVQSVLVEGISVWLDAWAI